MKPLFEIDEEKLCAAARRALKHYFTIMIDAFNYEPLESISRNRRNISRRGAPRSAA